MYQTNLSLADLVNLEDWQKIQDSFSEILGITLRTIDTKGKHLTRISGPSRICNIIPKETRMHSEFCRTFVSSEDRKKKVVIKEETSFKCPFGLTIFVIPIKALWNRIVAYIIIGPLMLNKRKDRDTYIKEAEKSGVDAERLMDALIEISVLSFSKVRSTTKLLNDIFSYMALTGYHKKRLGEIGQEVIEADPLFTSYYEEKVLNALLSTCTAALDIDSGSVMIVDRHTQHLRIKVASKLDEKFVNDTNMKIGEGIAGMAAASTEPIILPKDRDKSGIAKKLKRGYIKSSVVIPFNKANAPNVYGVINLNIVRRNKEFSDKDIALLKELINLTSIALLPVK